jgi:thymidylate synthase
MFISRDTLDDVLLDLYPALLERYNETVVATRGETAELIGVLIEIKRPRARLSRSETRGKLYSSLGELVWYLSRGNSLDFIEKYVSRYKEESQDAVTVYGGYGPRLFGQRGNDQVRNVIELLRGRPTSRRAVIQIFNAEDIAATHIEIPCTTTFQFFVRNEYLDMVTTMRSNDAYLGLPHDVFCFTMLQEIIARSLGRQMGVYRHFAGSLHLYKDRWIDAQHFVDEAYQQRIAMPEMPEGDPWPAIDIVLKAEDRIRNGDQIDAGSLGVGDYWSDLIRIIQIYFATGDTKKIEDLAGEISFRGYRPYILGRLRAVREE